jgi:acetoin utilization deacetylase AcuC-like enzyme
MLALHDPDCLLHETIELLGSKIIPAYESPARLKSIVNALENSPQHSVTTVSYASASDQNKQAILSAITSKHDQDYLTHLQTVFDTWLAHSAVEPEGHILPECFRFPTSIPHPRTPSPAPPKDIFARAGFYAFDMSTGITRHTYQSTLASAHLSWHGTRLLFPSQSTTNPPQTLLALCRPPGHHCDGQRAGGYCYVNNVAVAISTFRSTNPNPSTKIAVLDLDFHHGNGTQELYYADPSVLYVSIHGEDEFPYYTGSAAETGLGPGEGYNVNLPLRSGASIAEYTDLLAFAVERIRDLDPEFVVVSLGFDTYETDPIGRFAIATEDYEGIARLARTCAPIGGRVKSLVVLEGGYVVDKLGVNMLSWLRGWEADV